MTRRNTFTSWQCYLKLSWTTDRDECEGACGATMSESHYVEGRYGHYCSVRCRDDAESGDGKDT